MPDVTIPVKVTARTGAAILVRNNQVETWVPLSIVIKEITEPGPIAPETVAIVLQDWQAKDRGLVVEQRDDQTADLFGGAA